MSALGAQAKVDGLTAGIHGAIQIDLHVGFIHAPRATDWARETIPALLELRRITLHFCEISV
jgi:hypothetical protein